MENKRNNRKWKYIILGAILFLTLFGYQTYKYLQNPKTQKITERYTIYEPVEILFDEHGAISDFPESGGVKKEIEEGATAYSYYSTRVFQVDKNALTWEAKLQSKINYAKKDAALIKTKDFYVYIYDIQNKTTKLNRKVDVKNIITKEGENYNPTSILDFVLVDEQICYVVYVADNETSEYKWFGLNLEDDKIVKIFNTDAEYQKAVLGTNK